jgi:hypothetical protein
MHTYIQAAAQRRVGRYQTRFASASLLLRREAVIGAIDRHRRTLTLHFDSKLEHFVLSIRLLYVPLSLPVHMHQGHSALSL